MLSDVLISGVRFGEETQNIGNIVTVEVLILNPNDPYIPVHKVSVDLSHIAAAETGTIDGGLRTADSDEHNFCNHSSTAKMGVLHTHGVAC